MVINRLVGGERPERFRGSVAAMRAGERPTLDFMHALLPHEPLEYLPTGQRYQAGSKRDPSLDGPPSYDNAFLTDQAFQRHLLQVGFVDRLLGEMMAQLRRAGLWDRALVVLTADHGVAFRVKPTPAPPFVLGQLGYRRELTPENAEDIVTVPLFVKYPEQPDGRIDPKWARTIDVLPTIADELGIRLPFRVDGASLRPPRPVPATLEFRRSDGARVDIDRATLERDKADSLAHQIGLLGTTTWDRAYRIGPHPELIGQAVGALPTLPRGQLTAAVEDAGRFAQVEPDSSYSPSHIAGRLSGGDPADRDLAFAVDGRIVSMGRSFASLGPHRAELLLDAAARRVPPRRQPARRLPARPLERAARPRTPRGRRARLSGRLRAWPIGRMAAAGRGARAAPPAMASVASSRAQRAIPRPRRRRRRPASGRGCCATAARAAIRARPPSPRSCSRRAARCSTRARR